MAGLGYTRSDFMKWYWAILLTLVIFVPMVDLHEGLGSSGQSFALLITAISGVWVAAKSGSFGWGLFVMFLWPVAFPWFLIAKYPCQADAPAREKRMRLGEIVS